MQDLEVKVYNKLVEKGIVGTSLEYIEELINIVDNHRKEESLLNSSSLKFDEKYKKDFEVFVKKDCKEIHRSTLYKYKGESFELDVLYLLWLGEYKRKHLIF